MQLDECFTFYGGGKRKVGIILGSLLSLFVFLKGIKGIMSFIHRLERPVDNFIGRYEMTIRQLVRGRIVFERKGLSNYLLFAGYLLLVFYATALFLENLQRGDTVSLKGVALIVLALIFLLTISPLIVEGEFSRKKNKVDQNPDKKTFWIFLKNRYSAFVDQVLFFVLMPFIVSTSVLTILTPFLKWNGLWLTGGLIGWVCFLALSFNTILPERFYYQKLLDNQPLDKAINKQLSQKRECAQIVLLVISVLNYSLLMESLVNVSGINIRFTLIGVLVVLYTFAANIIKTLEADYTQYKNDSTSP